MYFKLNDIKYKHTRAHAETVLRDIVQAWAPNTKFDLDTKLRSIMDSLDAVEVLMSVEDAFNINISDEDARALTSIRDYLGFLSMYQVAPFTNLVEPATMDNTDPKST